ncbi:unnamed protein product [Heligmosomoides polygyrus]|uniref:Uncharacterized protein n=1 Tax=Heligmosomoides polygyrus TaxID=6339 RepID=A0A183FTE1_HELPZ|nr:unnamed protein product [Heligmosomoides polygyrus]
MELTDIGLQKFLLTYRRTPCRCTRALRLLKERHQSKISLADKIVQHLRSSTFHEDSKRATEKLFNRHHGARPKEFMPNELIWVQDFQQGRNKWTSAKVLARRGDTVYDVLVNGTVQRRQANQMRSRASAPTHEGLLGLLDLLTQPHKRDEAGSPPSVVSTIDSPTATTTPTTTLNDAATSAVETSDSSTPEPVQRPQRQGQPPRCLEMNPLAKSYM